MFCLVFKKKIFFFRKLKFVVSQNQVSQRFSWVLLEYSQELQILRINAIAQLHLVSEMWRFVVHFKFFKEANKTSEKFEIFSKWT